ncbi:GDP-mannose 4,6-dehydratase [Streptomyces sp. NPDC045714]|uniref:GDP-mannose 4,6-dehydratase n=1 Tax=Streptomyces sp. NPDC045714 TaxID=3154913 RepID=UPI0033D04A29
MEKTALITGVTGQDGSYLAELLLGKGYAVHGLVRRSSVGNTGRIGHLIHAEHPARRLLVHPIEFSDSLALTRLLQEIRPDEVYNLAAQSDVRVSFDSPLHTVEVTGLGALRVLEAVRVSGVPARVYQASSSEMFGSAPPPQDERTRFRPRSPYGCAKVLAYHSVVNYREAYGMFVANGILFNHESPRRGHGFVTRKITLAAARIRAGLQKTLYLGNLGAVRDWGYAPDYVDAMWRMLQRDEPDDYIVATGHASTVRDFLGIAFAHAGLDWREHVRHEPLLERPAEVPALIGDATKARQLLGWAPSVRLPELARLMTEADVRLLDTRVTEHGAPM